MSNQNPAEVVLSQQILEFQQKLSNVLQIIGNEAKPGEKSLWKKTIPGNLDIQAWKPGCDACVEITKLEKIGDNFVIEGFTNIPERKDMNIPEGTLSTRIVKDFDLYIGEHFNSAFRFVGGNATKKLEMNPLYRFVTFQVIHDINLA